METEEPVKQGLLLFPPQGVLGQLKKTWHKRYCQLFKASKNGIERLEIWDSREDFLTKQYSPRIITLEACVKIGSSNQPKVIAIITKTNAHHFGCYTESETYEWIRAFQEVAFKDIQSSSCDNIIEEDNDLYCTSGEGVFSVRLFETEASKRNGLEPRVYTLVAGLTEIKLMDGETNLFTWPYCYIRKYGYRDGKFTFEAGRKCESGEGTFKFEHGKQPEIFRCIASKMKSMKELLRGDGDTSQISQLSAVDMNDLQYHAALSMEAGSRSPLPPTPNSSELVDFADFSTMSQSTQKSSCYYSASSSSESLQYVKPHPPLLKPKPAKPPRKYVFTSFLEKKSIDSELPSMSPVSGKYRKLHDRSPTSELTRRAAQAYKLDDIESNKDDNVQDKREKHPYDLVEVRNDAWKTHGIDEVLHTERLKKQRSSMPKERTDRLDNDNRRITNDNKEDNGEKEESDRDNEGNDIDNEEFSNDEDIQYERVKMDNTNTSLETASPIIHHNLLTKSDSTANYDKLQHIGSTYKLNSNPGYKTPNITPSISSTSSQSLLDDANPPSWNDYDIVEDISAIRLADDSNRGYGVIKKKTSLPGPKHTVFNDSEYAIVSKPKRV